MIYTKPGFPEDSEIVLCTVTKIQHGSVFVTLDEYGGRTGIINISEISPGRIRNIRDFVNEGKKSICKVLRVDQQKGHIDLSLRRVTESQRRAKNDWIKHELKAEKIVELAAKELKLQMKEIYDRIMKNSGYPNLYSCFEDVSMGNFSLEKILNKNIADSLTEMIKLKIRPPEVSVEGYINMITYAPDGVEIIKEALKKVQAKDIALQYVGGGRYLIRATADNYKKAEEMLKRSTDAAINLVKSKGGESSFVRKETSKKAAES